MIGQPLRAGAIVFSPILDKFDVDNRRVLDDLKNDFPLLCGARKHATVVARADYYDGPDGRPLVFQVHVIDPYPGAAKSPLFARLLEHDETVPVTIGGELALWREHRGRCRRGRASADERAGIDERRFPVSGNALIPAPESCRMMRALCWIEGAVMRRSDGGARCGARAGVSQALVREASGHRPSLLRGAALQWAG